MFFEMVLGWIFVHGMGKSISKKDTQCRFWALLVFAFAKFLASHVIQDLF